MTDPKRLFSNSARTTLATAVASSDTSIIVTDASRLAVPGVNQFITVTIDSGTSFEIIDVYGISGNVLSGCLRGREGTTAQNFLLGTRIENRATAYTFASFARLTDRVADVASVDNLSLVSSSSSNSYLCASGDGSGTPILAVKNGTSWRFANHPTILVDANAVSAGTTTGMSVVLGKPVTTVAGSHIISFLSGSNAGYSRIIQTASSGVITWSTPLLGPVAIGDHYQIYESSAFTFGTLANSSDDALIFSILFGA
jgi:hypothetical protein